MIIHIYIYMYVDFFDWLYMCIYMYVYTCESDYYKYRDIKILTIDNNTDNII